MAIPYCAAKFNDLANVIFTMSTLTKLTNFNDCLQQLKVCTDLAKNSEKVVQTNLSNR